MRTVLWVEKPNEFIVLQVYLLYSRISGQCAELLPKENNKSFSVTRTYCARDPDVVKTAPVFFVTVHYHLPVVFIHSPLGVQVQQHLLPEGVHPHGGEERIRGRRHIHAANLGT